MAVATAEPLLPPGPMVPLSFVVRERVRETSDTWTLTLEALDGDSPAIGPGQFVMVYVFGIGEVLTTVQDRQVPRKVGRVGLRELLPSPAEWKRSVPSMFRGSCLGFLIGLVPGPSPVIATFTSYIVEKKISRTPEEFGRGAIEAVAGPEAANNAAVGGAYVPLFALGIPFTPAMAVVLGALMLHGLTPGPNLIKTQGDLFWAVVASMYIGNVMLLLLNVPLVNVFVSILRVPRHILLPSIVLICLVGVYSVNASPLDLLLLAIFGFVGYALREVGFQPAPLILAMVIGPMIETSLRQSLSISGGRLADKLGAKDKRWYLWVPALSLVAYFPFVYLFLLTPNPRIALVFYFFAIVFAVARLILGRTVIDRVAAVDLLTVISISMIALYAHIAGRFIYLDVALVYGVLSFLAVVATARYLERGL